MFLRKCRYANRSEFTLNWLVGVVVLLLAGFVYYWQISQVAGSLRSLEGGGPSFSSFPYTIGSWVGEDVSLAENNQILLEVEIALNRIYRNQRNNQWVDLYIGYCGQPRMMLGHRPDVCYESSGWICAENKRSEIVTLSNKFVIPCTIYRFYKPVPAEGQSDEVTVLNSKWLRIEP